MNLLGLLALVGVMALLSHVTRFWPRVALTVVVIGTGVLVANAATASTNSLDVLGLTLSLEPAARDFLTLAFALSGLLALATTFQRNRTSLGFLFWSWLAWLIALEVNNFVVAVFAWGLGLIALVLAMEPRRFQRASGAAYYLSVVVVAMASLLLANHLIELYPLTPERTALIQFAILFLSLGLGLLFALAPFHLWVGPMMDEAPPPIGVLLLGLGQPLGLWLLARWLAQYPWVAEKSELFSLMALSGAATTLIAGLMALAERRANRVVGFAAVFAWGVVLLDFSHATSQGLAYAGIEILTRALSLSIMATSIVVQRNAVSVWMTRAAVGGFALAGLNLVGLRVGVGLVERWNLLTGLANSDARLFSLLVLAHVGLLVAITRVAAEWLQDAAEQAERARLTPAVVAADAVQVQPNASQSASVEAQVVSAAAAAPLSARGLVRLVWNSWRVWASVALLASLCALLIVTGLSPGVWFERAFASLGQLPFAR